jgi:hypothetical protein
VQLGKGVGAVADVERLAEMVVNERRRAAAADVESARLDFEDAEGHVREAIYEAYTKWDPARNSSLISYATWKARCALTDWFRDELGQFTPKALAWAISSEELLSHDDHDASNLDYDEVLRPSESRVYVEAALADATISHAIVLAEDADTRETLRQIVLPIACGYSHAEVAKFHGESEAWVSSQLRKLRTHDDLRVPA